MEQVYLENNHYDPALKELLASGGVSLCATVAVCCGITPLLEEFVYRGFVLTSLAAYASPPWAIITSSLIFSLVHFKAPEETLVLFVFGCILGTVYAKTGDLGACLGIHSLYNLFIVYYTLVA
ncbi:uncharacterized protein LOC112349154 [Selaginella moellendorffii]|uniref:uncharacterized protein LOC112349154 n=1 Tax=Selaginella moellendorffii TaxID=88036 RepID=UPI000D1C6DA1|nr:uncharacterized protein LOC112349154 [Selaginella moellendorffii]|eukprot:XP_024538740.1 uncharacterized protein LOC112349154 [Selaginella moellendorffii]